MRRLIVALLVAGFPLSGGIPPSAQAKTSMIRFEGTVIRLGPPVAASGRVAAYRLVKYRVERILDGVYRPTEIVVDHRVLTGDELVGLHAGARVRLSVVKVTKLSPRMNVPRIREPLEHVSAFYIADLLCILREGDEGQIGTDVVEKVTWW